jgi:hypothetical protein
VQVRNVELLVNGAVVESDAAFPFRFSTLAPSIATGGSTMTIQVRATDTGGNTTLSDAVMLDVVKDTFPPVLQKTSVAQDASLFFVRGIDLTFDKTLDLSELDASGTKLVNIGADGAAGTRRRHVRAVHYQHARQWSHRVGAARRLSASG